MAKKIVGVGLIFLLATLLLLPKTSSPKNYYGAQPEALSPDKEIQLKQQLVSQDLQLTDALCRTQCRIDLQQTARQIKDATNMQIRALVDRFQNEHPHIEKVIWTKQNPMEQGESPKLLDSQLSAAAQNEIQQAKSSLNNGNEYESGPIRLGNKTYFVLGILSADKQASLIGVVHQDILQKVAEHQIKNLRIVPYPSDNNWKIQSVDANTLNDVQVNHPEDNEGTSHYHKNEVVVKFKDHPTDIQLKQIQKEIKAISLQKLGYTYVFQSDQLDAKQLMNYFKAWNVDYVEPHFLYLTNETADVTMKPNDVLYSKYQWNLPLIDTTQGWTIEKGSKDIIVGIVDTGVDLNHPDLKSQLLPGYNVITGDTNPQDDVGHGTHVAGVISALVNNNIGVAGMTWYNPILPVKVLDNTGAGSTYAVAQGIIWAADHGAKVINMSLGNYADANFLHDAIKYAYDKDIVLIAASGNDNTERPGYPAAYPEVFAVAAIDSQQNKAPFSNYGDYIDVTAPGVNIASTYPNNQYAALSGTSMASPHVTALAALIRSANPLLKNTEVMDIMRKTAIDLGTPGRDKLYGYGQIDVVQALQLAKQNATSLSFWPQWLQRKIEQIQAKYAG
jgi:thermitase